MEPNQICDTTENRTIKSWAEKRGGKPALLQQKDDTGRAGDMLKIIFPDENSKKYELLSWDQFFTIFEENNLKFLFIDEDEKQFYRLVNRND
jgi:hypothetical protein